MDTLEDLSPNPNKDMSMHYAICLPTNLILEPVSADSLMTMEMEQPIPANVVQESSIMVNSPSYMKQSGMQSTTIQCQSNNKKRRTRICTLDLSPLKTTEEKQKNAYLDYFRQENERENPSDHQQQEDDRPPRSRLGYEVHHTSGNVEPYFTNELQRKAFAHSAYKGDLYIYDDSVPPDSPHYYVGEIDLCVQLWSDDGTKSILIPAESYPLVDDVLQMRHVEWLIRELMAPPTCNEEESEPTPYSQRKPVLDLLIQFWEILHERTQCYVDDSEDRLQAAHILAFWQNEAAALYPSAAIPPVGATLAVHPRRRRKCRKDHPYPRRPLEVMYRELQQNPFEYDDECRMLPDVDIVELGS